MLTDEHTKAVMRRAERVAGGGGGRFLQAEGTHGQVYYANIHAYIINWCVILLIDYWGYFHAILAGECCHGLDTEEITPGILNNNE